MEIIIFEPELEDDYFLDSKVVNNIKDFKQTSDIIIANRLSDDIKIIFNILSAKRLNKPNISISNQLKKTPS